MGSSYGLNVGRLIANYGRDWLITGTAEGYAAQRRGQRGKGRGQRFTALTLDQLAEILDREQRQRDI